MRSLVKRGFDLLFACLLILILSPVMIATALVVMARLGRPVLFSQPRPGLNGEIFQIYKFRTMTNARDEHGELLDDDVRLTSLGKLLRSFSLDELPELFQVATGKMSLVGPRPLHVAYLDLYTPEQARRHEVRPGITGLAQINGRNTLSWEERFNLDVWYVDHHSIWLDLKILFLTGWKVLSRDGVSAADHVTVEMYTGPGSVTSSPSEPVAESGADAS